MKVIIHRGAHEIGGSCVEIESSQSRILLDFGLPLPDPNESRSYNQEVDYKQYLFDIKGLYKNDEPEFDAVLVSHAHPDHYGLAHFAHPSIPVCVSEGTEKLLEIGDIFLPRFYPLNNIKVIPKWEPVNIGQFTVTAYLVDHSAPDALAFLVEADGKRLFYSGDFRAHGRKRVLFENFLKNSPQNIDCLILEGTMMNRGNQEFPDENSVEEGLVKIFNHQTNLSIVFCSSQNIDRVVSVYRAALRSGKTLVIDLYTAYVLKQLKVLSEKLPQHYWDNIRVKYWKYHADKLGENGQESILYEMNKDKIEMHEIDEMKSELVMLARSNSLLDVTMRNLRDNNGVNFIWSMWDGYLNENNAVVKASEKNGIEIQTIHTSGHAVVDDLKRLVDALKPAMIIPIHTEYPDYYKNFFPNILCMNDGEEFSLH